MLTCLTIAFVFGALIFTVPFAQARDTSANSLNAETLQQRRGAQQRRGDRNRRYDNRRNNRRVRTYYQTRNVRRGRYIYRETYRITVSSNGRQRRQLIRRVRLSRRY